MKLRLAVVMGDPTGIGPEILVRALARADVVVDFDPVVVGDRRVMARAAGLAGTVLSPAIEIVDLAHCPPEEVPLGTARARAGRAAARCTTATTPSRTSCTCSLTGPPAPTWARSTRWTVCGPRA